MHVVDITGQRFGLRIVLCRAGRPSYWRYRCDCGNEGEQTHYRLSRGFSCGCKPIVRNGKQLSKHGMAKAKPYQIWAVMKDRCQNSQHKNYARYGGRGISVCQEWQTFDIFWRDMGPTYQEGLSIERIDNNGNYEPGNCTWIPRGEQWKNTRPRSEWQGHHRGPRGPQKNPFQGERRRGSDGSFARAATAQVEER